jgi:hypothetical protein
MTYEEARTAQDKAHEAWIVARQLAQKLHKHKWEQRVDWAQYCPVCDATRMVKGKVEQSKDDDWPDGKDDNWPDF